MRLSLSKHNKRDKIALIAALLLLLPAIGLGVATYISITPIEASLHDIMSDSQSIHITDRNGTPLNITYHNQWNTVDYVPLYQIPDVLKSAFLFSEDKDFYTHSGVNWQARFSALWQNIRHRHVVRGASTISEQVVRIIHPRPRTIWARWVEGFESARLEKAASKQDILEFYLNQVPYAANRRGVVQAARYYFNRDLSTLSPKEMMALVVLARSPSAYDLYKNPAIIAAPLMRLVTSMKADHLLTDEQFQDIKIENFHLEHAALPVEARHFARFVRQNSLRPDTYRTTLDAELQDQVQSILDNRLQSLAAVNVHNAAAMVADYQTGEILAWVVGGAKNNGLSAPPSAEIDTVTTPRQPGSAMKPFLYTAALDKGWTGATLLNDSPLAEAVGHGLHNFHNYSNTNYGLITLRESLGNSLNIPALLTINYVGAANYLSLLQKLGFKSLNQSSEIYDDGLALGNGEVTLLEMISGYAALANKGVYKPLRFLQQQNDFQSPVVVYSEESTSIIGNILSDPWARRLEFGAGSVLNLPIQTAAKTGTSTDYRDAWTMAYNDRYVVGIWMGNLDNSPMNHVTGSAGPALVMRSIFSVLNKDRKTSPLYFSPRLLSRQVCIRPAGKDGLCPLHSEWFTPQSVPKSAVATPPTPTTIELVRPTEGLMIAYDPRIPADHQKFRFELKHAHASQNIAWVLDNHKIDGGITPTYLWPVERGHHSLSVVLTDIVNFPTHQETLGPVRFTVK